MRIDIIFFNRKMPSKKKNDTTNINVIGQISPLEQFVKDLLDGKILVRGNDNKKQSLYDRHIDGRICTEELWQLWTARAKPPYSNYFNPDPEKMNPNERAKKKQNKGGIKTQILRLFPKKHHDKITSNGRKEGYINGWGEKQLPGFHFGKGCVRYLGKANKETNTQYKVDRKSC